MVKCSFSGKEIPKGQGIMYVHKDGQIRWFFNSKCERNYMLHRKPIHYKWTTAYVKGGRSAVGEQTKVQKEELKEEKEY